VISIVFCFTVLALYLVITFTKVSWSILMK
jgi:hypothetical protein